MDEWKVGDRVMVAPTGRNDWTPGTVTEVDPAGLPRGVRVRFDRGSVNGCDDCYASHGELRRPPEGVGAGLSSPQSDPAPSGLGSSHPPTTVGPDPGA